MTFAKGRSGNPGGRPRVRPFLDALRLAIADAGEDHKILRAVAVKLLKRAEAGDLAAISFLADRLDGKPDQALTNGDDGPFEVSVTRIVREIVDPAPELPPDLSQADWLLLKEVLAFVKGVVPDANGHPHAEVFGVIRDALKARYAKDAESVLPVG